MRLQRQHAIPLTLLVLATTSVPFSMARPEGVRRMLQLQHDLTLAERENETLRRDIARLRTEIRAMKDDPSAVEKIARNRLGFVRPDELVFQFGPRD